MFVPSREQMDNLTILALLSSRLMQDHVTKTSLIHLVNLQQILSLNVS